MKASFLTDLLATAGLVLIVSGLYAWHGYLALIFAGIVLVLLARKLTFEEVAASPEPAAE